jgi:hypothetical protein
MGQVAAYQGHSPHQAPTDLPESLICEVAHGRPICYGGYRAVLDGSATLEEIMAESPLQAWLKAQPTAILALQLTGKPYEVLTGELGLLLGNGNIRGADISVCQRDKRVLEGKFSNVPPDVIIEIDTQIDTVDENEIEHVLEKPDDYLELGVKQVVRVFTANKKVMIARPGKPWLTHTWAADVEILENVQFNLDALAQGRLPV